MSKKEARGLYGRKMMNHPLPGTVWIQLPSATPSGFSGPRWMVVDPSALASAAGVGSAGCRPGGKRWGSAASTSFLVVRGQRPEACLGDVGRHLVGPGAVEEGVAGVFEGDQVLA